MIPSLTPGVLAITGAAMILAGLLAVVIAYWHDVRSPRPARLGLLVWGGAALMSLGVWSVIGALILASVLIS